MQILNNNKQLKMIKHIFVINYTLTVVNYLENVNRENVNPLRNYYLLDYKQ